MSTSPSQFDAWASDLAAGAASPPAIFPRITLAAYTRTDCVRNGTRTRPADAALSTRSSVLTRVLSPDARDDAAGARASCAFQYLLVDIGRHLAAMSRLFTSSLMRTLSTRHQLARLLPSAGASQKKYHAAFCSAGTGRRDDGWSGSGPLRREECTQVALHVRTAGSEAHWRLVPDCLYNRAVPDWRRKCVATSRDAFVMRAMTGSMISRRTRELLAHEAVKNFATACTASLVYSRVCWNAGARYSHRQCRCATPAPTSAKLSGRGPGSSTAVLLPSS